MCKIRIFLVEFCLWDVWKCQNCDDHANKGIAIKTKECKNKGVSTKFELSCFFTKLNSTVVKTASHGAIFFMWLNLYCTLTVKISLLMAHKDLMFARDKVNRFIPNRLFEISQYRNVDHR